MSDRSKLDEQAAALLVQKDQLDRGSQALGSLERTMAAIDAEIVSDSLALDGLLASLGGLLDASAAPGPLMDTLGAQARDLQGAVHSRHDAPSAVDAIVVAGSTSWEDYVTETSSYAERQGIELQGDLIVKQLSKSQRAEIERRIREEFSLKPAACDQLDYLIAGTSGLLGGILDVVFVGMPGEGALTKAADQVVDGVVERFAGLCGWSGPREGSHDTASAIGFLERKFNVNYDQTTGKDVGGLFRMTPSNHHLKSVGHWPDLFGLLASVFDQFRSTATFVSDGRTITIDTQTFQLTGHSFVAKVFSGIVNWFGHLVSDCAGSSGGRGNRGSGERGSGIPIPFYGLLQYINVGEFGQHRDTFAKVAVKVFESGYDMRHGLALSVPVLVAELLTRFMWTIRHWLIEGRPWQECVPTASVPELRRMLLVSHGALLLVDVTDASVRSGGNMVMFMARSNLIVWVRFGSAALVELKATYLTGELDIEGVDEYLDAECRRLLELPISPRVAAAQQFQVLRESRGDQFGRS